MFVLSSQALIRGMKHENPLTRLETYKELTYISINIYIKSLLVGEVGWKED